MKVDTLILPHTANNFSLKALGVVSTGVHKRVVGYSLSGS